MCPLSHARSAHHLQSKHHARRAHHVPRKRNTSLKKAIRFREWLFSCDVITKSIRGFQSADLSLGGDGSCTRPLSSGGLLHACKRIYVVIREVPTISKHLKQEERQNNLSKILSQWRYQFSLQGYRWYKLLTGTTPFLLYKYEKL